jgi:hypothetical protein
MSKKIILAAIAATFALTTMQAPAFATKGGHHAKSTFNANGGNGGNNNKGNNSGNGGNGGTIKNAGKAKGGTNANANGGNGGNNNSGNNSGNGGAGGSISF